MVNLQVCALNFVFQGNGIGQGKSSAEGMAEKPIRL